MKKNTYKFIIAIISIMLIITAVIPTFTYAEDIGLGDLSKYKKEGDMTAVKGKAESIIGILSVIGIVVSVVALIAIGIKFMLGSVEEKAEYKRTLIPYLIGAFMVFTVSLLPQIIFVIMENFH